MLQMYLEGFLYENMVFKLTSCHTCRLKEEEIKQTPLHSFEF